MSNKRAPGRFLDEWMELVTECRQSSLADAAWCNEHGISPSCFYNAVTRLRKKACHIPAPVDGLCANFFDWEYDGTCKHVGIVERCDGETVYTIEGNSGDAVKERSYAIRSDSIMGYGMVGY